MYSIVQAYCQWKNYILRKERLIHTHHKPLQFIQTQGKLQNDFHQKWPTYMHQFHINIKYKIGSTNHVTDYLSRPPIDSLTTVLHFYGNEASKWPQIYQRDSDFATNYQLLGTCTNVTDFHIQDGLLCHLGHLCVLASECAKMIWEAHYSKMAGHFGMEKILAVLNKHFYWPKIRQDVNKCIKYCTTCVIAKPSINK
jgi:hypothetical protein